MNVYGIGTGYLAWQATEKIQKNTSGTDFADMIANKEAQKAGIYAGAEKSASKKDVERVTEEYKKKHPDQATHVDSQILAGKNVLKKNGVENVSREDMTMEEYKKFFTSLMNSIPYDWSQKNDVNVWSITEKGWEQMKNDPDYEAWVLGYTAEDRSVNIPFASMPGYSPSYHTEKFGASIEEHLGQGIPMNSSGKRSLFGSNEESWWEKRHERLEKLQKEQEQRAEKRAILRRKEQQEMLNEKIAKQEQERSRLLRSWNNERKMSQVSAVYEANVMTDFAEGSNYVG